MTSELENMVGFTVFEAAETDEMASLLGDVFARRDPPAVAAGLTPPEFEAFVRLWCPKAAAEGLTIVARARDTGEMVGALLTEDAASAAPDGLDRLSSKFDPIFDILGQLDAEYREDRPIRPGEYLHLFLLGVASSVAGKGIAQGLVANGLSRGADRQYRRAITEATNKTSQHIFRKLGFIEQVHRSYGDHRFDGRAFFESIADQGGPMLMDRRVER